MISPFEYITVLISIILGMGITEILSSVGNVILRWERVKLYWPHSVLALLVFVFHFQEWWVVFELRSYQYWRLPVFLFTIPYQYWRLPVFLFTILYPVNLYILARILFPQKYPSKGTSLKKFYFNNCKRIFLFIFSLAILSILDNIFFHSIPFIEQIPQIILGLICGYLLLSKTKVEWIHKAVIGVLLLATIVTFIIEWDVFLIENK
jgi:hypothetical protein